MLDSPDARQTWIETGGELPVVGCRGCNRVYKPQALVNARTTDDFEGLSPYQPEGGLHVFGVSIECAEDFRCPPIRGVLVTNSGTSTEDALKEFLACKGVLTCPNGHAQRFPPDRKD
jgi:hypothetical protein